MSSNIKVSIAPRSFSFAFPVGTSRGVLTGKVSYFVFIHSGNDTGVGEGSPLPGISLEGSSDWQRLSLALAGKTFALPISGSESVWAKNVFDMCGQPAFSSGMFGLETAAAHLLGGGSGKLYDNNFTNGAKPIEINGLVWMDSLEVMLSQAIAKSNQGFTCIKFKIGTKVWGDERRILMLFRKQYPEDVVQIRVDANGAYDVDRARYVLDDLQKLGVHSIEQPIAAGQHAAMAALIKESPIPIALDEELISPMPVDERDDMIRFINAPYLVLKPSLIGGIGATQHCIAVQTSMGHNWWITSALETAVGLNALTQFAGGYSLSLPQGLSTGNIYKEFIETPIRLEKNNLHFEPERQLTAIQITKLLQSDPQAEL